ncbi:MAG: 30S ribosomal protein S13 [Chloroflexi bacterium]|nr:30S ribosomal protein S13 [Chloroflexota bacterium]|tara:strand:- start:3245 stop:3631 length:387 start_codon:yes stop_codon:yes gene_type:complete
MAMIAGVNIPDNKRINIALRYVYGIGPTIAEKIISQTSITGNPKVKDLTENDLDKIRGAIDNSYTVEGDLRVERNLNIRRLIDIGSYKGTRHRKNLPVNGQRTKTNARTKRGKKLAVAKRGRDINQKT